MKVMPTLEGGLRIDVETATDWLVLEQIAPDALRGGAENLPERLGALMDEESSWEEIVIPELKEFFSGQLRRVAEAVSTAQRESLEEQQDDVVSGELYIDRESGGEWYGALNQARLALESRYKFNKSSAGEDPSTFSDVKRSAYIRSQFYCALQSVLLEHVIE